MALRTAAYSTQGYCVGSPGPQAKTSGFTERESAPGAVRPWAFRLGQKSSCSFTDADADPFSPYSSVVDPDNTLLFRMVLPNEFSTQQRRRFFDEATSRPRARPMFVDIFRTPRR